jgi:CBS domain-containing protein
MFKAQDSMANFVGEIAVRVRPLSLEDSLARAAESVRTAPGGAAPVQEGGQIVGLVASESLADWIAAAGPAAASRGTVREVVRPAPAGVRHDASIAEALEQLRAEESPALPVVDLIGRYHGMVSRGELLSAAMGALRPPLIGGMATPFGVYLTDGTRRGGVGDAALISSGIFLAFIQILASWLGYRASVTVTTLVQQAAPAWSRPPAGAAPPNMPSIVMYALFSLLIFAALFRLSWVTGYHAAEHQVVHAIEQGDDLRSEVVKEKPRVHPRCGTNLMAAFGIFFLVDRWGGSLAFVAAILFWRFFGAFLQQYVTTRPASAAELDSGIAAGRQLLERYQTGIGRHASGWRRVWNMGLLQVALGFAIIWGLLLLAPSHLRPGSLEAIWFNNYLGN